MDFKQTKAQIMPDNAIERIIEQYGVYDTVRGYKIVPVFQNVSPEVRQEAITFWLRNKALPTGASPEKRVEQLLFLVINPDNEIVALNTAYIDDLKNAGLQDEPSAPYYFYRMFIAAHDRLFNVTKKVVYDASQYLKDFPAPEKPVGIVIIAENQKIKFPAVIKGFESIGWHTDGTDSEGNLVLKYDF